MGVNSDIFLGIALHPQNGYMFWTDWSAEDPSINRANLDGTNNLTLFGKNKVEWPNGITVDYISNRIYWVDAKRDYIGSFENVVIRFTFSYIFYFRKLRPSWRRIREISFRYGCCITSFCYSRL